ncbi:serine hydrolase family protein [Sulfurimonas lithotrophica]|uniref:Serine hydrolase family protein n=1 Tax=Sulfurimonas lithotrophica TaxID=2590022 RepID=A0A5P8P3Q5_9BACT|nr:alpha/beta hydrolase [Sulfurimonas lithotrophica]QFR50324.1 serine hydrolase family protein [Sulfurimonas lithotrophica]
MKKVLIVHGWGGSDYPHWQSWLAGEIAKDYGCVYFLKFSDVDNPTKATWSKELLNAMDDFNPDIVICHSVANTLWFHLANEQKLKKVQKLFLVAPPSMDTHIKELNEFFPCKSPTELYAQDAILVGSSNDPYMDESELLRLQAELGIEMKLLQNAGHINADSNFGKWEWLLSEVKISYKI